jgi:hypothetical protein
MAQLFRNICRKVAAKVRQRRGKAIVHKAPANSSLHKIEWAKDWLSSPQELREEGLEPMPWYKLDVDEPTIREWKARRRRMRHTALRRRSCRPVAADIFDLDPKNISLSIHRDLTKARSSLLTQARTGAIGLNAFLFKMRVPDIPSPLCSSGCGAETFDHIVLKCLGFKEQRAVLNPRGTLDSFTLRYTLCSAEDATPILNWFFGLGRLAEYSLAREIEDWIVEDENEGLQAPRLRPETAQVQGVQGVGISHFLSK